MFELDVRSRLPIYEQLIARLKELIINEILKSDEQLPSVRVLAAQLTVNPNTIQKAYRELERQGYIYTIPGKGNFVTKEVPYNSGEKLEKLKNELSKILAEAMYLGLHKEELINMIAEIEKGVRGGENK